MLKLSTLLIVFLFMFGCMEESAPPTEADTASSAGVREGVSPLPDPQVAVIETDFGQIVLELYPNIAPQTVSRFKQLIANGFYDGTTFHRINAEIGLIQGGDPLSKDENPGNDGQGDSSYPNLPAEFSDLQFRRGSLGAARRGASPAMEGRAALTEEQAKHTGNCQFFITLQEAPQFDEEYTMFGKVIGGMNNADAIAGAPVATDGSERPLEKIVIKRMTLQPRSNYP